MARLLHLKGYRIVARMQEVPFHGWSALPLERGSYESMDGLDSAWQDARLTARPERVQNSCKDAGNTIPLMEECTTAGTS